MGILSRSSSTYPTPVHSACMADEYGDSVVVVNGVWWCDGMMDNSN